VSGLDTSPPPSDGGGDTITPCDATAAATGKGGRRGELTASSGYLASAAARVPGGLGTPSCPWTIIAPAGQRINVTMYDFSPSMTAGAVARGSSSSHDQRHLVINGVDVQQQQQQQQQHQQQRGGAAQNTFEQPQLPHRHRGGVQG